MKDFFHFGKSESIVSALLLLMVILGLFVFKARPAAGSASATPSAATPAQETALQSSSAAPAQSRYTDARLPRKSHDSIITTADYAGPPAKETYPRTSEKYPRGTVVDLNTADSASLTRIPGIGPTFARRIVAYRSRLGGYYHVLQLQEVYGMDYERFVDIKDWFRIGQSPQRISLQGLAPDSLPRHPYLNYRQHSELKRLLRSRHGPKGWAQLMKLPAFTREDSTRLSHYFDLN
ncbi:ComEA family DNA-binding protein [Porphyromonas loveana]|uniref:Helix-hairpin-helix protein n=2 Tax=Porphyromonas loveana TaxID=1884669 RepID=A0A2U1FIY6_9PORP|nr:helix-hairpin-helix domain-containing protein [Porphyromonas loveana]PVZ12145.1 helix-hairpin-helix protein [Porphyromonas loveana]